ncbi:MAG: DNA gyrase subunit A [Anaerolineae bacterium]|nr:DNA gyrase subunit A [Anaerolineae bacterium]
MEIGTVRQVDIEHEMQQAYLDYAMSVIVSRALPDVRDGLKPVQRRILYAMHDMGLKPDKPYKKSARIVGEVLGKYHPHGDAAVYDAMVRMAQDFSMRAVLVDGQGNFGSIDGDGAAAMRYTEARLAVIAQELLADIEKDTVDFVPNFDGTLTEPAVLPSALPNLLVNGASGIAVGMATNIPPHNLGEVCDALTYMIDHWKDIEDISTADLLQFIQGPDFPTGGVVYRYAEDRATGERVDALESAYAVGKGRFTVQAKAHVEEMTRGRSRIVVTELPYQVNKAHLVERIAELVRDGRIEGISDLRDESDRQGLRVVIELTRTADPREVLSALFKLTPMQATFGVSMLALVDGEPRMLSLKKALHLFLEHRREIVTRRSRHDLEKAKLRAHILEGILIALANLDEVIAIIRRSQTAETAMANLRKRFKLTEIQAQAILDTQLRRLAALERKKIEEEYAEKKKLIAYLEDLLAHPKKILGVIRTELAALKAKYADPRRTQIIQQERRELTTRDLVAEQDVLIVASAAGRLRAFPAEPPADLARQLGDEVPVAVAKGNTRDDLLVCTVDGQGYVLPVHLLPVGERSAWVSLADLCSLSKTEPVVALTCPKADEEGNWTGFLTLVTRRGKIKRIAAEEIKSIRGSGILIGLDEGDQVVSAFSTDGTQEVVVCAANGQGIRFSEDEVRPMGLPAGGVLAMKLADDDTVIAAMPVAAPDGQVAILTRLGYGKRIALKDFPAQKRYGAGVVVAKVTGRTGPLACALPVSGGELLFVRTSAGKGQTLAAADLPLMARATQGKAALTLRKAEQVEGVVALAEAPVAAPAERKRRAKPTAAEPRSPAEKAPAKKRAAQTAEAPAAKPAEKRAKKQAASKAAGRAAAKQAPEEKPAKRQATAKAETAKPAPKRGASADKKKTAAGEAAAKPTAPPKAKETEAKPAAPKRKPSAVKETTTAVQPKPAAQPPKKTPKAPGAAPTAKKKPVRSVKQPDEKPGK